MKYLLLTFLLAAFAFAQCPLGFTPSDACNVDNPSCGLFTDSDGDALCDNPGPQQQTTEPEPEQEPEPEPEEEETPQSVSCPFGLAPADACDVSNARCALYTDGNGDILCDNPGPQSVQTDPEEETSVPEEIVYEEQEPEPDPEPTPEPEPVDEPEEEAPEIQCPMGYTEEEVCSADSPLCTLFQDADSHGRCDNAVTSVLETDTPPETEEVPVSEQYPCPLNFTEEEACSQDNPSCTLFTDSDGDGRCDNPTTDCAVDDTTCGLDSPSIIGCPLGLPPEAACPDSMALCPHWYGVTSNISCSNPAGGARRINIILITLGILLPVSTIVSRRFFGRRLKDRIKRNTAHNVVRGVSLMVLGFGVQGCFCPLGTFQYAFGSHGIAFLGISGMLIFLLPLVFSAFFGRVFCGWVCPMGAIQEFLYRIHVPGRFSPKGKFHRKLSHLSQVILFVLIAGLLLNRFNVISLPGPAPFCHLDPFHTMFTLFLSGSLVLAGVTILLSIFIRRFFCRYLCFYGAALGYMARLRLWSRIKGSPEAEPEISSDEEFDK